MRETISTALWWFGIFCLAGGIVLAPNAPNVPHAIGNLLAGPLVMGIAMWIRPRRRPEDE